PGERFEEGRGGPEDLRGGRPARGAGAESAVKLLGDGRRVRLTVQQGLDLFWRVAPAAGLANRFLQRIERDALAVGEASAGKNKRFTADTPGELLDQSRLPETCLTNYRHGHGHPLTGGPGVGGLKAAHLFVAANQRRIETDRQGAQAGVSGPQEEPIGTGALGVDGSGGELLGLLADEDLARPGGLREHHRPGSHVAGEPERSGPPDQGLTRRQAKAVNKV